MSKKKIEKKDEQKDVKRTKKTRVKKLGNFDYKTWGFVAVAVVALVIVIALILKFGSGEKIESAYFHDGEGKIVLTMDKETAALESSEYEPPITHVVYYHNNNRITEVRAFFEYTDEKFAKEAYDNLELGGFADSKRQSGRFLIFQVKRSYFEDLTLDELKEDVETMKGLGALILDYDDEYINRYVVEATEETSESPEESDESAENE